MATVIGHYDQGDTWTPQATFTVAGVATDPTTITARVREPDGTTVVIGPVAGATGGGGITRVSAGVYTITVDLDDAGYWFARFEGTGAAAGAVEHQATVDPSEFYETAQLGTRALVSLAETKDWLQYQNIDTENDLEIARAINDISSRFHDEAGREFKPTATNPQTRTFDVDAVGYRTGIVTVGDLSTITTVEILDTDWATVLETVATADYTALPLVREPWEPIRRIQLNYLNGVTRLRGGYRVRITGNWGFPAVPGNVRQAVLDAVASVMDRDVEHYRQDLATPAPGEGGTVVVIGGGRQRLLSLPPAAAAVAWSYRDLLIG